MYKNVANKLFSDIWGRNRRSIMMMMMMIYNFDFFKLQILAYGI